MAWTKFTRTVGMAPTHIPSWADPEMYYWGGRSISDESGGYREIWHSSFRNPLPDHNMIVFFSEGGMVMKEIRENGF